MDAIAYNAGVDAAIGYFRTRKTSLGDLSQIERVAFAIMFEQYIGDLERLRLIATEEQRAALEAERDAATRRAT